MIWTCKILLHGKRGKTKTNKGNKKEEEIIGHDSWLNDEVY